ncbi:histidine phosphatase family protein [Streptomyces sp. NBC_01716]|uniref:histidine phosphatase family protein n=1 Tax=Streptomyces sp. NBC_01716 TaxID=2975917 RepID=UPI002E33B687|nr:histidine phosphatase family protein [Streptomyces sp. NBC_01716]
MTVRVTLISPALSTALREARFGDGPLDAAGLRQAEAVRNARAVAEQRATADRVFASPSVRCRQTAEALGLVAEPLPELRTCAMGRWQGKRLDEVGAAEPEAVAAWLTDPAAAPHGGESLDALHGRLGQWLDALGTPGALKASGTDARPESARVLAVAEPDVVRALTVHAIGAPTRVFWRIDVRPLTVTELSGRDGRWNLCSGRPLQGPQGAQGD